MVVMLRQCCCSFSLGTGTIIIGIIEMIGGITNVVLGIIAAIQASTGPMTEENILDALITIRVTSIILTLIAALFTLMAVLLIIGARRNTPWFLSPWMIYTCFYIFATVVSYVINTVAYAETGDNLEACFSVLRAVLTVSLQTYFLLVVYSLYRELRGDDLLNV
ncbi:uncharacterized protein LOC111862040 isoform X1 [Cryptotermes secundus]|uniref:uncharacterized protein LOC111862040 isoform X1 n=1 Tax=Cryptotermes secundus TaxID=105785 RepID=UPI000CD7C1DF|nr:uncharacterized protein LOC111862040 isoform X1 [Cryptotermes secundus]